MFSLLNQCRNSNFFLLCEIESLLQLEGSFLHNKVQTRPISERWLTCSSASVSLEAPPYSMSDSLERAAPAEVPWVQFTIPSATCEDRVEEIYEDLCYVKFTSAMPEVAPHIVANVARFPLEINNIGLASKGCFMHNLARYISQSSLYFKALVLQS